MRSQGLGEMVQMVGGSKNTAEGNYGFLVADPCVRVRVVIQRLLQAENARGYLVGSFL